MATRWEVSRAVRTSTLTAPSRLVMFVLADLAEVDTAEIPERFTPSLTELTRYTSLSRAGVTKHLNLLEESGWVVRTRPETAAAQSSGERTRYRLAIPAGSPSEGLGQEVDHPVVHTGDHPNPRGGLDVVHEVDLPSPRGGLKSLTSLNQDQTKDSSSSATPPTRDDVERICQHLAKRIEANGSKRPTITKAWRDAARLLLDKDERTETQVHTCIEWCQSDEFWRGNVMSMPKLRDQYDRLRLAAQRSRASPNSNGHAAYRNPTSVDAYTEDL